MPLDYYSRCLVHEVELLQRREVQFKLKAKPIVDQLIADADRPLPDQLPSPPPWTTFEWPRGGEVDLRPYWKVKEYNSAWKGNTYEPHPNPLLQFTQELVETVG